MIRKLIALAAFALTSFHAGSALAFTEPNAAEVYKKVHKSVIRISGISLDSPVAFAGGYGGGSGVVFQVDYDRGVAYALTNHHVSGDALINAARFWDGSEYKALLVATEPGIDTALLELHGIPDERNLPDSEKTIIPAVLGDSDAVQIGEYAIAMGAPGADEGVMSDRSDPWQDFMLQQTITMRVVTGRQTDPIELAEWWSGWRNSLGRQVLTNCQWRFITQSAINPGNSGGPLFNSRGEVIGLNHAHFGAGSVVTQNQNYTIPSNAAKNFAYQILTTGKYELPWLGLDVLIPAEYDDPTQISHFIEKDYDPQVIKVFGVRRDSPGQRAGLQRGDIVVEMDGQSFPSHKDFRLYIMNLPIGKQVPVTVKRNGAKVKLAMEVAPKRSYDSEFSL